MLKRTEILIAGAGPAGLALAASLASRGHETLVVDPAPGRVWDRSFGGFTSSFAGLGLDAAVSHLTETSHVTLPSGEQRRLAAGYVRFDTERLQTLLTQRARAAGATVIPGLVRLKGERAIVDVSGELWTVSPRLLVDATAGGLRGGAAPRGYQSAYGFWLETDRAPIPRSEMCLMDCRRVEDGQSLPPTFLYAMAESEERLFVQETVLCSPNPVSFQSLERRLHLRLKSLGIEADGITREERCLIPLGQKLPRETSSRLPYGSAAGMVQPASGYQISRALRLADEIGGPLSAAIREGKSPEEVAQRGLAALWTKERRRAFSLYEFGLESLLRFNPRKWEAFLAAFFELPEPLVVGFMDGTLGPSEVASCMWNVFVRAPMNLRMELLTSGSKSLGLLKQSLS